ncbi:hypothetical protein NCLIV_033800 [Neospora caninum Liverpool]|uniref:Uncharacterized protein n=1 Tax=Neospora caninum (strain Liverpool) TaxID=572307 RepID=F0VIN2_NEOCL|nr:hypothetical protein NCLIV_033800 [Neospora caninum Liverpool]CBZ53593.1 hypothetical protein NCLIV_033800 [Neospora caninum Liverpool]|eukprot:XP_003883625.1 hypothetical protein NCLIV_033800 [Neospora caninum Liverpool]
MGTLTMYRGVPHRTFASLSPDLLLVWTYSLLEEIQVVFSLHATAPSLFSQICPLASSSTPDAFVLLQKDGCITIWASSLRGTGRDPWDRPVASASPPSPRVSPPKGQARSTAADAVSKHEGEKATREAPQRPTFFRPVARWSTPPLQALSCFSPRGRLGHEPDAFLPERVHFSGTSCCSVCLPAFSPTSFPGSLWRTKDSSRWASVSEPTRGLSTHFPSLVPPAGLLGASGLGTCGSSRWVSETTNGKASTGGKKLAPPIVAETSSPILQAKPLVLVDEQEEDPHGDAGQEQRRTRERRGLGLILEEGAFVVVDLATLGERLRLEEAGRAFVQVETDHRNNGLSLSIRLVFPRFLFLLLSDGCTMMFDFFESLRLSERHRQAGVLRGGCLSLLYPVLPSCPPSLTLPACLQAVVGADACMLSGVGVAGLLGRVARTENPRNEGRNPWHMLCLPLPPLRVCHVSYFPRALSLEGRPTYPLVPLLLLVPRCHRCFRIFCPLRHSLRENSGIRRRKAPDPVASQTAFLVCTETQALGEETVFLLLEKMLKQLQQCLWCSLLQAVPPRGAPQARRREITFRSVVEGHGAILGLSVCIRETGRVLFHQPFRLGSL